MIEDLYHFSFFSNNTTVFGYFIVNITIVYFLVQLWVNMTEEFR